MTPGNQTLSDKKKQLQTLRKSNFYFPATLQSVVFRKTPALAPPPPPPPRGRREHLRRSLDVLVRANNYNHGSQYVN
jgi:hypothetical protein